MTTKKTAYKLQENKLMIWRHEKKLVKIFLMNGVQMTGYIQEYDEYTILLEANDKLNLIFKHAISTIVS